jgi:glycosyltransferase involved in cell wall biosynthesis
MKVIHVRPAGNRHSSTRDPVRRLADEIDCRFPDTVTTLAVDAVGHDALRKSVREASGDVVATSSSPLSQMFAVSRAAEESRRPCVVYGGVEPVDLGAVDQPPAAYRALRTCLYVAGSIYEADCVMTRGVPAERVFVIGPGVDPDRFERGRQKDVRSKLGLDGEGLVGYLDDTGGCDQAEMAITAMERVWRHVPGAQLLLAGRVSRNSARIDQRLATLPAERRRRIVVAADPTDEDTTALVSAIDVLVAPDGAKSIGVSFVEAWAAGKPVIAARRGAIPTMIDEGVDGLLVEYGQAAALGVSIVELLQNHPRAEQMGQAGRSKVLIRHTWARVADQFEQVFQIAVASAD